MPSGSNKNLDVGQTYSSTGGTTVTYALAQTQNGELPTIFEAGSTSGNLLFADSVSHKVSTGTSNRNIQVKAVHKMVAPVSGIDTLIGTCSADVKFSFPKNSATADRGALLDVFIDFLIKERDTLVSTQMYY